MIKYVLTLAIVTQLCCVTFCQLSIGVTFGGIAYHPKQDKISESYKWKLDKVGKFVGYTSVTFLVEYRMNENLGLKYSQTLVNHDCIGQFSGITHLGVMFYDNIVNVGNDHNEFNLSLGPLWYYRKDWSKQKGYVNDPNFISLSESKIWEMKYIWHGGFLQYKRKLNDDFSLSFDVLPAVPHLLTSGIGIHKMN